MHESAVLTSVLKYLGARSDVRVWRHNTGRIADRHGRVVSFGLVGSADVIGIRLVHAFSTIDGRTVFDSIKDCDRDDSPKTWVRVGGACGQFLAVECKSDTGRQSEAQRNFQKMVESMGGLYLLVRDVADLYPWFPPTT